MINRMKEKLSKGDAVFGFWSMIPAPMVAHVMASSGADFVICDLEHGNASMETLESVNYAIRSAGATPICRLPRSGPEEILRVLEVGVQSVLMSHVGSVREAQELVKSCLYPPEGKRGLSPFTANHAYEGLKIEQSMAEANKETFVGALVEGTSAITELSAIANTPGLDMIYLGLFDLASSLGHAGDPDHPEVLELVKHVVDVVNRSGKVAGTVARDSGSTQNLLQLGFRFIAFRNDTAMLMQACRTAVTDFNNMSGGFTQ
jgi:2-keto-3-deoxy-L-rhamnonate aldolase RhmA